MKNRFYQYSIVLSVLFIASCSTDYAALKEDSIAMQKVANIEKEPITRLSFVPIQKGAYDDIEIVVYQNDGSLSDIMPAAGSDSDKESMSE